MVYRELTFGLTVRLPLRRRLWLWRRGFLSYSDALGLDDRNYRYYLSDYEKLLMAYIAEEWTTVVRNKLAAHLLLEPFDDHRPELHGFLDDGRTRYASGRVGGPHSDGGTAASRSSGVDDASGGASDASDAFALVDGVLRAEGSVVLKPVVGHGGRGVSMCAYDDGDYYLDGDRTSRADLAAYVSGLEEYLVFERIEQTEYATRLFPDATNTIRVLTMWDYRADEPFVAEAIQRIGVTSSSPVDNWGAGGMAAPVDVDSGELAAGVRRFPKSSSSLTTHETHPDTGAQIEGVRVPGWRSIRETTLEMAEFFRFLPYIGWDVVATDEGFSIVEMNPGAGVFQEFGPAKADPRVRRFFERHDCLVNDPDSGGLPPDERRPPRRAKST